MAVTVEAPTAWPANAPVRPGAAGLLPMGRVAERVGGPHHPLPGSPKEESDYLLPTSAGWVDGLRLADGVAFTHELSEVELKTGVLAADDDLAFWAALAEDGLRLAALEQRVRALAPRAREVDRRAERLGGEPDRTGKPVPSYVIDACFLPARPGVTEEQAFEEARRERSKSWVDEPNGLGMTPREAARVGGAARAELAAMLDDMQWRNERNDRDPNRLSVMDVDWIRQELGILAVT